MSAPLRMRTSTIEASPAEMGKFLRRLGDDIERADGDIVLIALSVYPNERDPLGEGDWDVQVIVDTAEARGEQPEPEPVSDESSPYCPCGGSCHRASSPCSLSCVVHHASGCWEQPEGPTTAVSDCPTCWSTDPAKRWNDAAEAVCPDSWHGGRR